MRRTTLFGVLSAALGLSAGAAHAQPIAPLYGASGAAASEVAVTPTSRHS